MSASKYDGSNPYRWLFGLLMRVGGRPLVLAVGALLIGSLVIGLYGIFVPDATTSPLVRVCSFLAAVQALVVSVRNCVDMILEDRRD